MGITEVSRLLLDRMPVRVVSRCSGAFLGLVFATWVPAADWQGHLATLRQAQIACKRTDSRDCLPYLAEAVAVADVLTTTTKVSTPRKGQVSITVVFRNGNEQRCSENWLRNALNGQRLMHVALGMDARQHSYWVDALLAAAQSLCQS